MMESVLSVLSHRHVRTEEYPPPLNSKTFINRKINSISKKKKFHICSMEFHAAVIKKKADLCIDVESCPYSARGNRQELNYVMRNSCLLLKINK